MTLIISLNSLLVYFDYTDSSNILECKDVGVLWTYMYMVEETGNTEEITSLPYNKPMPGIGPGLQRWQSRALPPCAIPALKLVA